MSTNAAIMRVHNRSEKTYTNLIRCPRAFNDGSPKRSCKTNILSKRSLDNPAARRGIWRNIPAHDQLWSPDKRQHRQCISLHSATGVYAAWVTAKYLFVSYCLMSFETMPITCRSSPCTVDVFNKSSTQTQRTRSPPPPLWLFFCD